MNNNIDYLVDQIVMIERQSLNRNFEVVDIWFNSKASKGKGDAKVVGDIIALIKGESANDNKVD